MFHPHGHAFALLFFRSSSLFIKHPDRSSTINAFGSQSWVWSPGDVSFVRKVSGNQRTKLAFNDMSRVPIGSTKTMVACTRN